MRTLGKHLLSTDGRPARGPCRAGTARGKVEGRDRTEGLGELQEKVSRQWGRAID